MTTHCHSGLALGYRMGQRQPSNCPPFRSVMIRFHQSESASDAKRYYAKSDYYLEGSQETIGEWGGRAARLLGLEGQVNQSSFERLCDNLHPATGERLTARTRDDRTVGNDITFDCP